jgi:polysaccharide biosynthesis transport protein
MSRDFSTVVDDFDQDRPKTRAPGVHFDIKRFLSLRLFSVLAITLILALPLAISGWFAAPDVYTATAVIQFRSQSGSILEQGGPRSGGASYESFVTTELAKLKGSNVLNPVLDTAEIQELESIQAQFDKLTYLRSTINTSKSRNNELVTVSCTMKSRDEALTVLRKVMQTYETQVLNEFADIDKDKVALLNETIDDRSEELRGQRKLIEELEGRLGAMDGGTPEDSKEAEQYRNEYLVAQTGLRNAEYAVADVKESLERVKALQARYDQNKNAPIYDLDVEIAVKQDPEVANAMNQVGAMETNLAVAEQTRKPGHPALVAGGRKLESARAKLTSKEQQARADALKTLSSRENLNLELANSAMADATTSLNETKERYDTYVTRQQGNLEFASAERARIQQLKESAEINRAFIENLENRMSTIQLDEKAAARVKIVSKPYASPSKDRKTKYIMAALGLFVALGLGLSYGVLRELLDQQVRTRQDLARISDLPTIASIPRLGDDRTLDGAEPAMLMAQHPNSIAADEYRRILARLLFPEDNAAEISSLLVVSASTMEGKTSVASNIAIALEQANRRVLLIDLSSQKPDVERSFGLEPSAGLSELLRDQDAREDLIRKTAFENLGVVGPGMDADELAGRLASREMMDFMEWADEHFDHLVVDTPPLLLMSDAKLLAPAMDGVLFVVGAGGPSLGMVSRCLRDLEQLRANIIGIVINGIRNMRGGYLRKNQSLYYAYTEQAAQSASAGEMPEINILDEEIPAQPVAAEVVLLPFDEEDD